MHKTNALEAKINSEKIDL